MLSMLFFESSRLRLRPIEPDDAAALFDLFNHPDLAGRRYGPWGMSEELPLSRKQVEGALEKWAEGKDEVHFAVVLKESGELIGYAEMSWDWDPHCPHVSLVIAPAHQRKGFGAETLGLLMRYLLDCTPAHNISSWVAGWNEAGRAFAKQAGFTESGRMRRAGMREGRYYDLVLVDILRAEWGRE